MSVALGKTPEPHEIAGLVLVVSALLIQTATLKRSAEAQTGSAHRGPALVARVPVTALARRDCKA